MSPKGFHCLFRKRDLSLFGAHYAPSSRPVKCDVRGCDVAVVVRLTAENAEGAEDRRKARQEFSGRDAKRDLSAVSAVSVVSCFRHGQQDPITAAAGAMCCHFMAIDKWQIILYNPTNN